MGKLFLLCLSGLLMFLLSCQKDDLDPDFYYYFADEKIPIEYDWTSQFVLIQNVESEQEAVDILSKNPLCRFYGISGFTAVRAVIDSLLATTNTHECVVRSGCYDQYVNDTAVHFVAPFIRVRFNGEVMHLGVNDRIHVKLRSEDELHILDSLATVTRTRVISNNLPIPRTYVVVCSRESMGNPIELANLLYETGYFEYSEPGLFGGLELLGGHKR